MKKRAMNTQTALELYETFKELTDEKKAKAIVNGIENVSETQIIRVVEREVGVLSKQTNGKITATVEQKIEHLATKKDLDNTRVTLKEEIASVKAELKEEIASVKAELKEEIASVKAELKEEIAGVKTELKEEVGSVKTDLANLKTEIGFVWNTLNKIDSKINTQFLWLMGTMITILLSIIASLVSFIVKFNF